MRRAALLFVVACSSREPARATVAIPPVASSAVTTVAPRAQPIPTIHVDDSTEMVGIPRVVLERVIRKHAGELRACWERAKDPSLEGRVWVRVVIDPSGDPSNVESTHATTISRADVASCVVDVFKTMQFPQPEGGSVIVAYPVSFPPRD